MSYRLGVTEPTPSTWVSDAERDAAVERLTGHVASGRLALDEFDSRAARIYAAVTRADVESVFDDLPTPSDFPAPRAATVGPAVRLRTARRAPLSRELVTWASVGILCLSIWLVTSVTTGTFLYPWPMWVIGPWGAMLALQHVTGGRLGSGCHTRAAHPIHTAPVRGVYSD